MVYDDDDEPHTKTNHSLTNVSTMQIQTKSSLTEIPDLTFYLLSLSKVSQCDLGTFSDNVNIPTLPPI